MTQVQTATTPLHILASMAPVRQASMDCVSGTYQAAGTHNSTRCEHLRFASATTVGDPWDGSLRAWLAKMRHDTLQIIFFC